MQLNISEEKLDEIYKRAQSVQAELLRFGEMYDFDGAGEDAFRLAGQDFDDGVRQRLKDALSDIDDVALAQVAAISLAGDGSYAPDEIEGMAVRLQTETNREELMGMLTSEPLLGSMLSNGMGVLGILR